MVFAIPLPCPQVIHSLWRGCARTLQASRSDQTERSQTETLTAISARPIGDLRSPRLFGMRRTSTRGSVTTQASSKPRPARLCARRFDANGDGPTTPVSSASRASFRLCLSTWNRSELLLVDHPRNDLRGDGTRPTPTQLRDLPFESVRDRIRRAAPHQVFGTFAVSRVRDPAFFSRRSCERSVSRRFRLTTRRKLSRAVRAA